MNIKDIARISGVGVSTVSRVINNHPDVKKETRDHILEIIKEYNYIPNNSARILKQNNTKNIGLLVKGVFNPFFSEMIKSIGTKIEKMGYVMILQHSDSVMNDVDSIIGFVKEKRLQGLICLGGNFDDIKDDSFDSIDAAIVLASVNLKHTVGGRHRFSSIGIDNEAASYRATEYLINNGHKNICLIVGDEKDSGIGAGRYEGYKKAMEKHNLPMNDNNIIEGGYEYKKAYKETQKFLQDNKDITAIFAISDAMAVGAAKAVADTGLKIGEDISIMGFDGMDIANYYNPTITTMKQPRSEIARLSVEILLALINDNVKNSHEILEVELLEGNSCVKIQS
ncbi:MAG: LacI family DNA-binding transcriptional regulator [Cellulosilyticaceae bacterium]